MPPRPKAPALSPAEVLAVCAAFTAASVVFTYPLAFRATRALTGDLIDTLLNTWIVAWDAKSLAHGLRHVWNAPIFFPDHDTLAFSESLFGIGFLVAPVYWLSGNAILTYNVAFLLSFVISGVGAYLLARSLTGSRMAAAIAGAAYAFAPYRFAHLAHIQLMATGWMPLALWALHEYFVDRKRRWLAVFAVAAVLQVSSNTYVGYIMLVPGAILFASELWQAGQARVRAAVEVLATCLAIAIVLSPIAAAYVRVRKEYQHVRPRTEMMQYSADLRSYTVVKDSVGFWRWLPTAVTTDSEKTLFPGLFIVALAVAGVRRRSWPWAAMVLVSIWLSLGPTGGLYSVLLAVVPGMDGMRIPARYAIVVVLGLSILAAYGAAALTSRVSPRWQLVLTAFFLLAVAADGFSAPLQTRAYEPGGRLEDRAVAQWLAAQPPGAVLHLPIKTDAFQEVHYQYVTLFHSHPIVNGYSGYASSLQESLKTLQPRADSATLASTLRTLREIGVYYVVVHKNDFLTNGTNGKMEWYLDELRHSPQVVSQADLIDGVAAFTLAP